MNPPFSKQQDIDHVVHAVKFLRTGGTLVSVMSKGVTYRENKKTKNFWGFLKDTCDYGVVDLPEDSFKVSGTKVSTVVIKAVKKW